MAQDESYNGWTNRETWAVALHVNNDQGWQESVHEALREGRTAWLQANRSNGGDFLPWQAGETIRENVESVLFGDILGEEDIPASVAGALSDIGSLWRVNWDELGAAFLSDLAENDGE